MPPASTRPFRERLRARESLAGTFVKTAGYQVVEVLGASGLDFAVIDAEHAPYDRNHLDVCLLAGRASNLPLLVRLPNAQPHTILDVLDMGATGILVPHAKRPEDVREAIAAARYRGGVRGFSNSPRAGGYGRTAMTALVDAADRDVAVLCQVEDREAVDCIDALVAIDEVDCLFIGRADLAVSYGVFDVAHADVDAAVRRILAAGAAAKKPIGIFLADAREVPRYTELGASLFVIGSDQSMLRAQATALAAQFTRR
jgi:2-keto-3-deoxy-L-rhamnonate aldolase RhmA